MTAPKNHVTFSTLPEKKGKEILAELPSSDEDRRRNRVRMELTPARASWLLDLIGPKVKELDIDSPEFKELYQLYNSMRTQLQQIQGK
jgi:hypothetical protein